MSNPMRHMLFAASWTGALVIAASSATAQSVPGRDLLDFQIGALGEPLALAVTASGGLYNPATLLMASPDRSRFPATWAAVGHLSSPSDRGLAGQIAMVATVPGRRWGAGLTAVRVGVDEIVRTETDPTTPMGTVLYDTFVGSATAAVRVHSHVAIGGAARYRLGRADTASVGAFGADAGVLAERLLGRVDLRLAASSFLWRPDASYNDRPAGLVAADARVWGDSATREARLGYSFTASRGAGRESFLVASGRYRYLEARAGFARLRAYSDRSQTQTRFAVGLHYARFSASVARQSGASFGPLYQFTLSTRLR